MKLQRKKTKKCKRFFKVTITKKIILLYLLLLLFTVIITSISSYLFFQRLIDNQISLIDVDSSMIRVKLEEMYDRKTNLFELPDLNNLEDKSNKMDSSLLLETIEKDYPDYHFKVETIEGVIEYKEEPKLIFDGKEENYFFEITRQISFTQNLPFKSLKLTLKLNYYQIILKSLLFGALFTIAILIPVIIVFSRTITAPILNVSKGAREIAGGRLGIRVESGSQDELGELANSFNYMSKELHKMKRIRDDLLAVISHELRSPLGRIKGYTEILNDLDLAKEEETVYYDSIFGEIDYLNYMVGEIIEISRLELNKEQLFLEPVDLGYLVERIKNEMELSKPIKNNVKYNFEYEQNLYCNIDIEKIKRVFINAIENSIKAEATEVSLKATLIDENLIEVVITDNGHGIPEDQLELVFEKFYRIDKSRDRKTGGFGLGLAICKGIINEHGGIIYFTKKEGGAELHVEIPYSSD